MDKPFKVTYRRKREHYDGMGNEFGRYEVPCATVTEALNFVGELRIEAGNRNRNIETWLWSANDQTWQPLTDATDDEIAIIARTFSMPWQPDGAGWTVPGVGYEITPNGPAWDLRYNGTALHTDVTLFGCMAAADRHRGISQATIDAKLQKAAL